MAQKLNKGEIVPLQYTKEARHRVLCAINWDARSSKMTINERIQNLKENVANYDLDLACVMYDAKGNAVDGVSGRPEESVDQSGKVYHTGDDETGTGDLDDESISVELKDLPENIAHIVFVVEVQSAHTFSEVENPSIRLADGMDDKNQINIPLGDGNGADKNAYIFARIFLHNDEWMLHFINEYLDGSNVADWILALKKYLKTPTA